jgi:hypothetical protein
MEGDVMDPVQNHPITELAMSLIANDLAGYRRDLELISGSVSADGQSQRIRDVLAGEILTHSPTQSTARCSAVDASYLCVPLGTTATHASLAAEVYSDESKPRIRFSRVTVASRGKEIAGIAQAVRLPLELDLIATSTSDLVFADGSWWSRLMEANKIITEAHSSGDSVLESAASNIAGDGGLLAAISNTRCVSISKLGVSVSLSRRPEMRSVLGGVELSDQAVLRSALRPGEYTRPRLLKDATDGEFGIEKRHFSESQRDEIRSFYQGTNCLRVLYYMPHGWSNPIRMEIPSEMLNDIGSLFDIVHTQTAIIGYLQPWVSKIADLVSKQIKGAAVLYGGINRHEFPGIGFNTRT